MEQIKVHSGFILGAVYDEDKRMLRIRIGNTYYYYYGVTKQKVARFRNAPSKGAYFCKYIKDRYQTRKRKLNSKIA